MLFLWIKCSQTDEIWINTVFFQESWRWSFITSLVVRNRLTWDSFLLATFKFIKSIPATPQIFYLYPETFIWPVLKNSYIKITLKTYTYKSENILITPIHTKKYNCVKKHNYKKHPRYTQNSLFLLKITFKKQQI